MKVLHITSHLGGGLGSVIIDFLKANTADHTLVSLDWINNFAKSTLLHEDIVFFEYPPAETFMHLVESADIVLVHYYDHPMLQELLKLDWPGCRLVFWCHNNKRYSDAEKAFPDMWVNTSPIQGPEPYIWSTRDMTPFLRLKKEPHEGFNIGYIGTVDFKKMHPLFFQICNDINISKVRFFIIGENNLPYTNCTPRFTFTGKIKDIKPYLAEMDLFMYPLRPDHYGTCEQVIGEAMSAGVPPITLNNPAERFIIESGWDGFVAPSIFMFVKAVENIARDKAVRTWMGENARISASLYDHIGMLKEWDSVFNKLMNQPKRSRE